MKTWLRISTVIAVMASMALLGDSSAEPDAELKRPAAEQRLDNFHEAFDRLKQLEGTWDEEEYGRVIEYRLTGRGSALIEEYIGEPPMTSVYHLDGDDLRMTHYCNAGNQPRMIAASYGNDTLKFDFVDVTNLASPGAYHTRTLEIAFEDDDHIILNFVGLKEGEDVATTHTFTRRRTP